MLFVARTEFSTKFATKNTKNKNFQKFLKYIIQYNKIYKFSVSNDILAIQNPNLAHITQSTSGIALTGYLFYFAQTDSL